jgi:hypothetical protein
MYNTSAAKRRANFKVVEQDLLTYDQMVEDIRQAEKEVDEIASVSAVTNDGIYMVEPSNPPKLAIRQEGDKPTYMQSHTDKTSISDPTANRAEAIQEYKQRVLGGIEFKETCRRVRAIDSVLYRLDSSQIPNEPSKAKVIRDWYFVRQLEPAGIALKYSISEATAYRWRNEVVQEIGRRLGFPV